MNGWCSSSFTPGRKEEKYQCSFAGSFLSSLSRPLTSEQTFTNKPDKIHYISKPLTPGLLDASVLKGRSYFGSQRSVCVSLSLGFPMVVLILLLVSIIAVKMGPLPLQSSSGLREHLCNYIYLKDVKYQLQPLGRVYYISLQERISEACVSPGLK